MIGKLDKRKLLLASLIVGVLLVGLLAGACSSDDALTIYSSRTKSLVQPLLEHFADEEGIKIRVKYDSSTNVVNTLLEEGENTPADVVYLAEPSGFGPLLRNDVLDTLAEPILDKVDARFRSPQGRWVGISGRSKVVVYNTRAIDPEELPDSVLDFTDPTWSGRIGWAPTHGEWQELVTAIRLSYGEEVARQWLEGIKANNPRTYRNLISIVDATAKGEVDVGFVNHYYVHRFIDEVGEDFSARNYYLGNGDPGALVTVSGAGIIRHSDDKVTAQRFIEYLLAQPAQRYFTEQNKEYPLVPGVQTDIGLLPVESLDPPDIDLSNFSDLEGTLRLLRETEIIP